MTGMDRLLFSCCFLDCVNMKGISALKGLALKTMCGCKLSNIRLLGGLLGSQLQNTVCSVMGREEHHWSHAEKKKNNVIVERGRTAYAHWDTISEHALQHLPPDHYLNNAWSLCEACYIQCLTHYCCWAVWKAKSAKALEQEKRGKTCKHAQTTHTQTNTHTSVASQRLAMKTWRHLWINEGGKAESSQILLTNKNGPKFETCEVLLSISHHRDKIKHYMYHNNKVSVYICVWMYNCLFDSHS